MMYIFTQADITYFNNYQVNVFVNGVEAVDGSSFSNGDTLKAKIFDGVTNRIFTGSSGMWFGGVNDSTGQYKSSGSWDISGDGLETIIILSGWTDSPWDFDWNVITEVVVPSIPIDAVFLLTQDDIDYLALNDVYMYVNNVVAVADQYFLQGDYVEARIENNPNRYFLPPQNPTGVGGFSLGAENTGTGQWIIIKFDNSIDLKYATYTFLESDVYLDYVIELRTEIRTPEVLSSNNVYSIDNEILKEVNSVRIETTIDGQIFDYGQYILSVLKLPFDISGDLLGGKDNIILGGKDTSVLADTLIEDHITYNLGVISVPVVNDNALDYVNTIANLHLPFSPPIEIDLEYVIGCELSIEYVLDVYQGSVVINVISTKTDGDNPFSLNISSTNVDIGVSVPFMSANDFGSITNDNYISGSDNGVRVAFIELVKDVLILENGFFTSPVVDESVLLGNTGYVEVEHINLKSNASKSEKDMLVSLLKQGVIIND